ncbi:MAG TPA: hypothetical protein VM936_00820 [Pyrinomonadaceae bacterium]|nr:hypothetical protein [Pyrinomonadaceae bacterium]
MSNRNFSRARVRSAGLVLAAAAYVILSSAQARAATWKGLEPFVSKRTDVERVLGAPVADRMDADGTLEFNVSGGKVTVFFVTPKFSAAKRLPERYNDTVLQIVLQHERATDTPESMDLVRNKSYEHRHDKGVDVYLEPKEGIAYTFVDSHLKTTRYTYSMQQLGKIQRGK